MTIQEATKSALDECRNNESIPVDMEVDLLQSLQNRLHMA